jgi:hypothetical protein
VQLLLHQAHCSIVRHCLELELLLHQILIQSCSGDSYSSVGGYSEKPIIFTSENPLGTPLPEEDLWTDGGPNWVGHLITKYSEAAHLREGDRNDRDISKPPQAITVFDYAVGGETVSGVKHQIEQQFIPHIGKMPGWAAEDTLFGEYIYIQFGA